MLASALRRPGRLLRGASRALSRRRKPRLWVGAGAALLAALVGCGRTHRHVVTDPDTEVMAARVVQRPELRPSIATPATVAVFSDFSEARIREAFAAWPDTRLTPMPLGAREAALRPDETVVDLRVVRERAAEAGAALSVVLIGDEAHVQAIVLDTHSGYEHAKLLQRGTGFWVSGNLPPGKTVLHPLADRLASLLEERRAASPEDAAPPPKGPLELATPAAEAPDSVTVELASSGAPVWLVRSKKRDEAHNRALLCLAPCNRALDVASDELIVKSPSVTPSSPLTLPPGRAARIEVDPGDEGMHEWGLLMTMSGLGSLGLGGIYAPFAVVLDEGDGVGHNTATAIGFAASGLVQIIIGVPMFLSQKTEVRVFSQPVAR